MSDWTALRAPVEAAVRALQPAVLDAFRAEPDAAEYKEDGSPITALDYELEKRLAGVLLPLDETFGLYSEEAGVIREGTPMWHLDPLDGTANFCRRRALFATQLALVDGRTPLFSAIYEPMADRFCWAAKDGGAWQENTQLRLVDREPSVAHIYADVSRTGIYYDDSTLMGRVRKGCYRVRALGSAALHLRDVACGTADGYLGGRTQGSPLHDLAPGVLLIREAGGVATDGRGGDPLEERRVLVAGSQSVHDWLCEMLAG